MIDKYPDFKEASKRLNQDVDRTDYKLNSEYMGLFKGKKYYIITHGCLANERDSEIICGILEQTGFIKSNDIAYSDLIIVNTCAIRSGAEDKVLGEIGALKRYKTNNPNLTIAMCGCMAQEEDVIKELKTKYRQIELIFGTNNIHNLLDYLKEKYDTDNRIIQVESGRGSVIEKLPDYRNSKYKALVNIMYGCNKFCTYCIVPYTRGQERSRKKEDILEEVIRLKNSGYKEINLLGQNVNAYGKDLKLGYDFSDLLEEVAKTGIYRIRFMTSHPWDFNDSMIQVIKKYDNIMPYIHLPLQSGSDNILKKMNRSYDSKTYKQLFDKLKNNLPNYSFSTDIIVAFPGESEDDFNKTIEMVDYCQYDNAYTFIFSKRKGTVAYNMDDNLDDKTKSERLAKLNQRVAYWANYNNMKYKDKIVEVLVDGPSKKDKNILSGYSKENKLVNFIGNAKEGDIVNVLIDSPMSFSLNGKQM